MFASLGKAIGNFFDGTLKGVILRSIGLTVLLFIVVFAGLEFAILHLPTLGAPWVNRLIALLAPVLFIVAAFALGAPIAAIFGSLFLDRVARTIETRAYPTSGGRGVSATTTIGAGARLAGLAIVMNAVLLLLDVELVPPVPEILGIATNAWLLGREYFELVALRHMSRAMAGELRRRNGVSVFAAGTIISFLSSVPVLDLIAPLLGVVMMVHLFMRVRTKETSA